GGNVVPRLGAASITGGRRHQSSEGLLPRYGSPLRNLSRGSRGGQDAGGIEIRPYADREGTSRGLGQGRAIHRPGRGSTVQSRSEPAVEGPHHTVFADAPHASSWHRLPDRGSPARWGKSLPG